MEPKRMEEAQQQRTRRDIPKGAVVMTRSQAVAHQLTTIYEWKPQSDVWPLVFGRPILTVAAAITGGYINHRFRRKLRLLDYGLLPTMISLTAAPAVSTAILHSELIVNNLVLLEVPCPLCLQSKSALTQVFTGLFLPLITTPLANFTIAIGSGMYNVPPINDLRGIFKIVGSAYQPLIPTITLIFTFHALLAGFVTYLEIKSFLHIQEVQYFIEQDFREQMYTLRKS